MGPASIYRAGLLLGLVRNELLVAMFTDFALAAFVGPRTVPFTANAFQEAVIISLYFGQCGHVGYGRLRLFFLFGVGIKDNFQPPVALFTFMFARAVAVLEAVAPYAFVHVRTFEPSLSRNSDVQARTVNFAYIFVGHRPSFCKI